jgi:hypothetical protein
VSENKRPPENLPEKDEDDILNRKLQVKGF